jgi:subtilisin family serine protease
MAPVAAGEETVSAPYVAPGKLEDALLDQLAGGPADLIVQFVEQADLSPAFSMGWDERGQFVHDTLRAVAARSQAGAHSLLDAAGLFYQTFLTGNELYVWDADLSAAQSLAALNEVEYVRAPQTFYVDPIVEQEPLVEPNALAWGIADTKADQFWGSFGVQGDGIKVANIDTGVQWDHPALVDAFACPGDPGNAACWRDPSNICPGGTACDNNGHGTHTMGTMVADDDPALTWQAGMAPNATWIACKGCESTSCSEYALNTCADWIVAPAGNPANRPHVVNNSWGGGSACDGWYWGKVDAWRAAGVFPAFSAGNAGSSCNSLGQPSNYQDSFASAAHASNRTIASFSSRGPAPSTTYCHPYDPYTKPNISAPGVGVCSTVPGNGWSCGYSGTSMASPHTAGAVALLWSCNPSLIGQMDLTFEVLQDNADPPPDGGNCGAPPTGNGNYTWGYGPLNVYAAGLLWCGDVGYLDGHVLDAFDGSPIAGATVNAGGPTAVTDGDGYYLMTLAVGTYDVSASHPLYTTAVATDVEIEADATTVQDFELEPKGMLSGYVTDFDNGFPLDATVAADDGTWAETDDTGYYEMLLDEGTYDLTASAKDYANAYATVDILAGEETQQDFALVAAVAFMPTPLEVTVEWQSTLGTVITLSNRMDVDYEFEFQEQPGGFAPFASGARLLAPQVPAPSIPAELFLGVPPAGYVPPAALDNSAPDGPWQTRTSAPFVSMDNVYLDHEDRGYLVSGYGANGQVGIYNPDTDSWTTGATEPAPQIQYPVDGCLGLNAGGDPVAILFNDTTSGATTLHRYNIATNSWDTAPVPAGFPANGLWAHDIASVWRYTGENVCYISGGATTPGGGNTSALYAYYPDTNTVENLGTFNYLAQGFAFHASWYVPWIGASGAICVGGGVNAGSVVSGDTQCYDIAAGVFNAVNADLGPLPAGLWGMADGVLYEDGDYQLWVAQGADAAFALWPNSAFYSQNDGQWYLGPTPPRTGYRVEGTNIAAADGCSFYVVGGSSGGFSPTNGHERNFSADCPPVGAQDVPWFGQVPISGTVPAEGQIQATMLFTATVDVGVNQPGDYSCTLRVQGDPRLTVPVNMTVLPPDTMGQLHGYVLDNCTGAPVEAHIEIFGGDPITHTMSDKGTGYYSVWLYPGDYDLAFSAADYLDYEDTVTVVAGEAVALDVDLVPDRPCIAVFPEEIEVWVLYGIEVYTMPGGLDVINHGGQELEFSFLELPPLPGAAGGIDSLTGSNVTFDPSVGGDASYIPGTAQTFCFQADSYSPDWEYALNVWQKFPADWVVSNVYVQGTPSCTSGGTWGSFSWSFATAPYEVNISHPRYHSSGGDHCTAHYCFDVTSAPAGYEAPVSWFWNGDKWGSPPYNPCSDDGYTPAGQPACDEMLHPVAAVPIGAIDVPWFWQEPESGTVPALDLLNVDILFTAVLTDPLPVGTYTATLIVVNNDPFVGALNLLVTMHVVEDYLAPIPSFESNSPVLVHEEVVFTNTTLPGLPPETTYLWDLGDGTTSTLEHPTHIYSMYGVYTVTLQACNVQYCAEFADTVQILPLELWLPIVLRSF